MKISEATFVERARGLRWLLLDVDGVLTDGRIFYGASGEELQAFHIQDGLGLKLAQRAGLQVGLLSGRHSLGVVRRAEALALDCVMTGRGDKAPAFAEFLAEHGCAAEQVAFMGDDLPDLPVMGRAGLAFAPVNAVPEVRAAAHLVTKRAGGHGAVREVVERLLSARGVRERLVASFLAP